MCLMLSLITLGQDNNQNIANEFIVTAPTFVGGDVVISNINTYVAEQVDYPYNYIKQSAEGTVVVQFYVTTTGEVANFEVVNSVDPKVDEEVIRVIKTTKGMWVAGMNNGVAVPMKKEVSISFKFQDPNDMYPARSFFSIAEYHYIKGSKKLLVRKKVKRALNHFNEAVRYLPYDKSLLVMRGVCLYELGDYMGAYKDWDRVKELGGLSVRGSDLTMYMVKFLEQNNLLSYVTN